MKYKLVKLLFTFVVWINSKYIFSVCCKTIEKILPNCEEGTSKLKTDYIVNSKDKNIDNNIKQTFDLDNKKSTYNNDGNNIEEIYIKEYNLIDEENSLLKNVKNEYVLNTIINNPDLKNKSKIIEYNKNLQKKIDINSEDSKNFGKIEFELELKPQKGFVCSSDIFDLESEGFKNFDISSVKYIRRRSL